MHVLTPGSRPPLTKLRRADGSLYFLFHFFLAVLFLPVWNSSYVKKYLFVRVIYYGDVSCNKESGVVGDLSSVTSSSTHHPHTFLITIITEFCGWLGAGLGFLSENFLYHFLYFFIFSLIFFSRSPARDSRSVQSLDNSQYMKFEKKRRIMHFEVGVSYAKEREMMMGRRIYSIRESFHFLFSRRAFQIPARPKEANDWELIGDWRWFGRMSGGQHTRWYSTLSLPGWIVWCLDIYFGHIYLIIP